MNKPNRLGEKRKFQKEAVDGYLERIKCDFEVRPTLRYLRKLHRNHLLHIPFENLDIHVGNEIILDIRKIYDKVINKLRGGFCYELNGLFCHLLWSLGFEAKMISARVLGSDGSTPPEFDHLAIIVTIDDKEWLADVGFGRSFLSPKEMAPGIAQVDYNSYYKIMHSPIDDSFTLLASKDSFQYKEEYIFSDVERQYVEFVGMCQYHQTSPESKFTQKKVVTMAKPDGRVTLTDSKLIVTKLGERHESDILNMDEFKVKLWEHFHIRVLKNK